MFRTISLLGTPARSLSKTLNLLPFSSSLSNSIKLPTQPSPPSTSPTPSIPSLTIFSYPFSSRHKKTDEDDDTFAYNRDPNGPPKLFVVQPRLRPDTHLQAKLSEALNLANSLEEPRDGFYMDEFCKKTLPSHVVVQNPVGRYGKTNAATYFGPGTVENIKCHLNAAESEGEFDAVFVNAILSGVQQRNLERAWDKPVLDRVGLIIEIFNAHAQTKEAKLQSELAALEHKKTRLVRVRGLDGRLTFGSAGEAEVVSARGRGGSGGRGFISGAGETELQLQKRRILERHGRLLSQIAEVRRTRAVQRASRRRHGGSRGQGLSTVAVVGYTNAGKSTLVNALSHSELYSDDRLFATVDPRLRSVDLPSGRKVLLSDTVGFISDLPVELVEAFHATLEEVVEADLLVHVLDSSAVDLEEQRSSVLQVLRQIGVSDDKLQNMIEVWNKVDLQGKECGIDKALTECEDDEAEYEDDVVNFEDGAVKCEDDEAQEAVGIQSDLSLEESIDEDDIMPELSTKEDVDDQNIDNLEEGKNVDVQPYDNSKSWKMEDGQQGESSMGCKTVDGNSHSQPQDIQRVKTSAVTGIGLQELLILIDDKLKRKNILERRDSEVFDRKWRPLRDGNTGIAVEQ